MGTSRRYVTAVAVTAILLAACTGGTPASEPTGDATGSPHPSGGRSARRRGIPGGSRREDGRHAVYLRGIDVEARTLTFDAIQWLSGAAASKAYLEETGETGGPPTTTPSATPIRRSGLWTSPRRWRSCSCRSGRTATRTPAREHGRTCRTTSPSSLPKDGRPSRNPFWITVQDQVVAPIEEQYVP